MSSNQMAVLFERDEKAIRKHVNNVFNEGEVDKRSNTHFLRVANSDKPVAFYSLNVVISVGYRVKFQRGVYFRQWANQVLKQYLLTGYSINDKRCNEYQKNIISLNNKVNYLLDNTSSNNRL